MLRENYILTNHDKKKDENNDDAKNGRKSYQFIMRIKIFILNVPRIENENEIKKKKSFYYQKKNNQTKKY